VKKATTKPSVQEINIFFVKVFKLENFFKNKELCKTAIEGMYEGYLIFFSVLA
jgi:hypothetical protein